MENESIRITIRYKDLKRYFKIFPPYKDELLYNYFHRLVLELEEGSKEWKENVVKFAEREQEKKIKQVFVDLVRWEESIKRG